MASQQNALQIVRRLLTEIKRSSSHKNSPSYRYVLSECRKYKTTDQLLCKAREEMQFLAATYTCYLNSKRRWQDINTEYSGRGERTIEETANLVGFKLPHDPK